VTSFRRPGDHLSPRSFRTLIAGAVATVLTVAGLSLAPAAMAAPTHTIGGTITYTQPGGGTTANGSSYAKLFRITGTGPMEPIPEILSGGVWNFGGLTDGRYRVQFTPSIDGVDAGTWLGGDFEDSSQVVTVSGGDVTGLDVTLPLAGSISGTVAGAPNANGFRAFKLNPTTGLFEKWNENLPTFSPGGAYSIGGVSAGTYIVRFADHDSSFPAMSTDYYQNSESLWNSKPVVVATGQNVTGIDGAVGPWYWYTGRLAGTDRFQTSATISSAFFDAGAASVVYVANGMTFPDALGASAAAARSGGPLLMTRQDSVPAATVTEIKRLHPPRIVVIGGTGAIGDAVYNQLAALAPSISRVAGIDRFATSRAVAADAFEAGRVTSVFIATGLNFPDALVAGSAAGYQASPLVLVNGASNALDESTKDLIQSLAPSRIYIVGGTGSVSPGIQADLQNLGTPTVLRLGGIDRFATAQAVNSEVFPFADTAFMANAFDFPDALSISAVAGVIGAPLLLARPTCLPFGEFSDSTLLGVSTYWTVGGTGVLSPDVEDITWCSNGFSSSSAVTGGDVTAPEATTIKSVALDGGLAAAMRAAKGATALERR
jgi:putative cell wall-binding protein